MKKILVAPLVVMIFGIVLLSCKNKNSTETSLLPMHDSHNENHAASGFKMGYFELDSLDNNYKYEQDIQNELIASEKRIESQISELQKQAQDKWNELQKKASSMSQAEQEQYSNEWNNLAQQTQGKIQRLQQSMSMERDTKLRRVKQRVQNYLKTYAKENGYNYIVGTSFDSDNFYYKDSSQNITAELIQNLNQQYADSLKKAQK